MHESTMFLSSESQICGLTSCDAHDSHIYARADRLQMSSIQTLFGGFCFRSHPDFIAVCYRLILTSSQMEKYSNHNECDTNISNIYINLNITSI